MITTEAMVGKIFMAQGNRVKGTRIAPAMPDMGGMGGTWAEKRGSPRIPMQLEVEFTHEDIGYHTFTTKNISETGVFYRNTP